MNYITLTELESREWYISDVIDKSSGKAVVNTKGSTIGEVVIYHYLTTVC